MGREPDEQRTIDHVDLQRTLDLQAGVIARRQALDAGETAVSIARRLRRREWIAVHPGVYVSHNGPLTWLQRAGAAVLAAGPGAALCLDSAMRAHQGKGQLDTKEDVIHVAIPRKRTIVVPEGVVLHRMSDLSARVQWNRQPPRTRYDDTVLDLAARADRLASVGYLADACGSRRTTASRLRDRLAERARMDQREWLNAILSDVADGTCSVLEHGYLDLVERPHGLPEGVRQAPRHGSSGRVYVDVHLPNQNVRIELDGQLFHTATDDRDRDLERDLDAAVDGTEATLRLGFGQVYERPCSTAAKIAAVLQRHGWDGELVVCGGCRAVA